MKISSVQARMKFFKIWVLRQRGIAPNFFTLRPPNPISQHMSSTPRCGSGPKYRWRALPLHPPRTPPPTPDWAAPSRTPGTLQKEPRGVGGRGRERAGREGLWVEGRVLQLQWGMGDPPNTSWGQTHIWGSQIWGASLRLAAARSTELHTRRWYTN